MEDNSMDPVLDVAEDEGDTPRAVKRNKNGVAVPMAEDNGRNGVHKNGVKQISSSLTGRSGGFFLTASPSGSSGTVTKKLTIKGFSAKTTDIGYHHQTMGKLEESVVAIQQARPASNNYEELYISVRNLCEDGKAEAIYSKLKDLSESYVESVRKQLPEECNDEVYMRHLQDHWKQYCDRVFEIDFLESTDFLYAQEGSEKLDTLDLSSYLHYANRRLKEEKDRVLHYLDARSEKPLIQVVEKQLISEHVSAILQKGLDELLKDSINREPDLKLLYDLFARETISQATGRGSR
ncbi:unnamed protein product [Cyprideis torosa]|uniref:Cullin N-terminal domain-containing protein n=1 Tax=Cyprideis torosa TaxID=163714 RepID=A0A7R8WHI6_9CRUS|nr:unnamed protein product [Cyprideis torosa]CAG0899449.1 unnamed protein product [Cyprideis torosa]